MFESLKFPTDRKCRESVLDWRIPWAGSTDVLTRSFSSVTFLSCWTTGLRYFFLYVWLLSQRRRCAGGTLFRFSPCLILFSFSLQFNFPLYFPTRFFFLWPRRVAVPPFLSSPHYPFQSADRFDVIFRFASASRNLSPSLFHFHILYSFHLFIFSNLLIQQASTTHTIQSNFSEEVLSTFPINLIDSL